MNLDQVVKQTEEDPRFIELYSIAEEVEISLMEQIDGGITIATAFLQYPDKVVVLAISENEDRFTAVLEALENGIDRLEEYEGDTDE